MCGIHVCVSMPCNDCVLLCTVTKGGTSYRPQQFSQAQVRTEGAVAIEVYTCTVYMYVCLFFLHLAMALVVLHCTLHWNVYYVHFDLNHCV